MHRDANSLPPEPYLQPASHLKHRRKKWMADWLPFKTKKFQRAALLSSLPAA